VGGDPSSGDGHETDAADFFSPNSLPPLSLDRVVPEQIHRMFQLHTGGAGMPADFD